MQQSTIDTEIQRIYDRDGHVTTSTVVEESKPKTAPLHDAFEWSDRKAGHEYRLIQSRKLIRRARIIQPDNEPSQLVHVPTITNASTETVSKEGYYKPAEVIARSVDEFTLAYEAANTALASAMRRLAELEKAVQDNSAPDDMVARVQVALKALDTASNALAVH